MSAQPLLFASLKAFGDFVIQVSVVERASSASVAPPRIAIGAHLRELREALSPAVDFIEVPGADADVPAAFDVKKRGIYEAARSLRRLRRALGALPVPAAVPVVFDQVGRREAFIAGPRPTHSLQAEPAANIYEAYASVLQAHGYEVTERRASGCRDKVRRVVGVFPGSRIAAKAWTARTVLDVVARCESAGCEARAFLLEGERLDGPVAALQTVPRRFADMVSAVRSVDRVVSADSLPAHLAEYFGRPVFVLSSFANPYWLPRSAWASRRWALLDEAASASHLEAFLAGSADAIETSDR